MTIKDLKKPHSSRWAGGADTERGTGRQEDTEWLREVWRQEQVVPHPLLVGENWEGHLRSKVSQPQSRPPSQSSSIRKISPHNF